MSLPAEFPFIMGYPSEDEDPYLDDSDMSDSIQPGYEPQDMPRKYLSPAPFPVNHQNEIHN